MSDAATPQGLLIVLSAASGTGKTTVARALLKAEHRMVRSISATTRAARPGEVDGDAYRFVSEGQFQRMAAEGAFLEWARVHTHHYGTPAAYVRERAAAGHDVLMIIDVQGGREVKVKYPDAVLVFLAPPSIGELTRRLTGRGSEDPGETAVRLRNAVREIADARGYDYVVVNDTVPRAVANIRAIVAAEKVKAARQAPAVDKLLCDAQATLAGAPERKGCDR
jgi:guanylate kinase